MADALKERGYACHVVASGEEARASIKRRPPDVVVVASRLEDGVAGADVLEEARRANSDTEVILLLDGDEDAHGSAALARVSTSAAYDCVAKPVDLNQFRRMVGNAAQQALSARESRLLHEQVDKAFEFSGIIATSELMMREIKRLKKIARVKSTVLIFGETGTGKELFAQAIHENSSRAGKPFRVRNCAAFSETLLESELFGHKKGAFTGAIADRKGVIASADTGTLFLDEIGDMPITMQAKLLRTLETGEVVPVGANDTEFYDVRFVAATNRDLGELVREGKFREDLFYRLHAHGALRIPPLRQRREDIPVLTHRFIEKANREFETSITGVAPETMRKLVNYGWPGNVRELQSVVGRMCLEADDTVLTLDDLPETLRASGDIVPAGPPNMAGMTMADVERLHIMNTLRMFGGNREKTAKALGIGARTLYRKLKDYEQR